MKILIVGASGLLGYNVLQAAVRRGHTVIATTHQNPLPHGLPIESHPCDLTQPHQIERLLLDHWPDAIVNAAALSQPSAVDEAPELGFALNVALPEKLAQIAHHLGAQFVHISTDMVFDGSKATPYATTDTPNPTSRYGQQKLEAERAVLAHCPSRPVVLRIPILNGNSYTQKRALHEKLFVSWAGGGAPHQYTDELRQPAAASNVADVIIELIERGNLTGIFHWAGSSVQSRADIARAILDHFELPAHLIKVTRRPHEERPINLALEIRPLLGKLRTQPMSLPQQIAELKVPDAALRWYDSLA